MEGAHTILQGDADSALYDPSSGAGTAGLARLIQAGGVGSEVGAGHRAGIGAVAVDLTLGTLWSAVVGVAGSVKDQQIWTRFSAGIARYQDRSVPLGDSSPTAGATLAPRGPMAELAARWTQLIITLLHLPAITPTGGFVWTPLRTGAAPPLVAPTTAHRTGAPLSPGPVHRTQEVCTGEGTIHTGAIVTSDMDNGTGFILCAAVGRWQSTATIFHWHTSLILQKPAFWTAAPCPALSL